MQLGQIMEERPFVLSLSQNKCQNVVQSTHNYPVAPHERDAHTPLIIRAQYIKQRAQILSTFADVADWTHYSNQYQIGKSTSSPAEIRAPFSLSTPTDYETGMILRANN